MGRPPLHESVAKRFLQAGVSDVHYSVTPEGHVLVQMPFVLHARHLNQVARSHGFELREGRTPEIRYELQTYRVGPVAGTDVAGGVPSLEVMHPDHAEPVAVVSKTPSHLLLVRHERGIDFALKLAQLVKEKQK